MSFTTTYTAQNHPTPPEDMRRFFLCHNGDKVPVRMEDIEPGQLFIIESEGPDPTVEGKLFRCTGPCLTVQGRVAIPCEFV
jgi:hypothetical protein